jgi:UDP-N-acetylmuramyl tripeptide synthase
LSQGSDAKPATDAERATDAGSAAERNFGFEDSRRLPGPNRYFGSPAVTLSALGAQAADPRVLAEWARRACAMAAGLGWPDPAPRVVQRAGAVLLLLRAPPDALLTATEVNEWAWERAAAAAGLYAFDFAQDHGEDAAAVFATRAAAERLPALVALREAAAGHGIAFIVDDAEVSVGMGKGSRRWPRADLPACTEVAWTQVHDIPCALVTGSNGKTTTARLIAATAAAAGLVPGLCCTEGIFVGDHAICRGDYAGPDGARRVLRHPDVEAAILETARGGILRRGLALQRADVAVVTNISADHLGEYGVDDAQDLAATKLVVAHAVRGTGALVLNADDPVLMAAADAPGPAAGVRLALFAQSYDLAALLRARSRGGATCGVRGGELWLSSGGEEHRLGAIAAMPLTVGGAAVYNIANLAAAALASVALRLPRERLIEVLHRFGSDPRDNPGRLERWTFRGAEVLIDYAHNPDGLAALLAVARSLQPRRLALLLGQAGNRDATAIGDLAATAARFAPDRIMLKELPLMLRGRALGEVPRLLEAALLGAGVPAQRIGFEADELAAANLLLDDAQPGDVIVLPVHTNMVREPLRARLELVR